MKLTRRNFFTVNAVGAAGLALARPASASTALAAADGAAMLVDTTKCVGCRGCEAACSEANNLAEPAMLGDDHVFDRRRETAPTAYTVVNRYDVTSVRTVSASPAADTRPVRFIKSQCMHCVNPACVSACPARAMEKSAAGPVVYNGSRCLGCRYCMVACPFEVPKFEYSKAVPYVKKCSFCAERQAKGLMPACAEVCPSGALTFGRRSELIEEARRRIYQNPDKYVHHIYGEHEAGGTSWLYLTDVPAERLGLKAGLSTEPYAALTDTSLAAVPVVMTMWPPLLMGLYTFSRRRDEVAGGHADAKEERHE